MAANITSEETSRQPKVRELRHRAQSTLFVVGNEFKDAPESAVLEEASGESSDVEMETQAEELMEGMAEWSALLSETLLGYIWLCLFHGLAPMVWFYPLNELDITGYELFIVLLLSPLLLVIPPVRYFATSTVGLSILRAVSVLCLASFQAQTTLMRLIVLSVGCAAANIAMFGIYYGGCRSRRRHTSVWGFLLAHILLLSLRIWWVSLNAVWTDKNVNSLVLVLGLLSVVEFLYSNEELKTTKQQRRESTVAMESSSWPLVGIGAGSLLFLTHWVYSEVSVVFRWAVSGHPDTGLEPNPWGVTVLIGSAVGVCVVSSTRLPTSVVWWCVSLVGGLNLCYSSVYLAAAGGIALSVYTFSVWPAMIKLLMSSPGIRTLVLTFFVYIVHVLAAIWVVAYNFVPIGGAIAREQTGPLMVVVMLGIGFPLVLQRKEHDDVMQRKRSRQESCKTKSFPHGTKTVVIVFVVFGLVAMGARYHHRNYVNAVSDHPDEFTSMIWTIHFAYDNYGWPSLERMATLINNSGADVIGLLETDASRPFLGNRDLTMWLEERLGFYADFGPATRTHTWGAMLLSKHPIISSNHHLLPSPEGELAPAISATVNVSGKLVDFVVVHMGNDRDDLDRRLQAQELANILRDFQNPAVFLGYVTSAPGSRDYKKLISDGGVKDIDETDMDRWCQYIFYKNLIRLGYARISHSGLSDTEAQLAKFRFTKSPDDADHGRITVYPEDVPEHLHFPSKFGSYYEQSYKRWDKHHYQDRTPKYFLP